MNVVTKLMPSLFILYVFLSFTEMLKIKLYVNKVLDSI